MMLKIEGNLELKLSMLDNEYNKLKSLYFSIFCILFIEIISSVNNLSDGVKSFEFLISIESSFKISNNLQDISSDFVILFLGSKLNLFQFLNSFLQIIINGQKFF